MSRTTVSEGNVDPGKYAQESIPGIEAMPQQPFLSLILPAYNEVRVIGETLATAQGYFNKRGVSYEIIVSVDGTDGTAELVREVARRDPNIKLTESNDRKGKGQAIRRGVQLAKGDIVGFVDADNKIPIEELDATLPWFDQGYDLVIGSRALQESHIEQRQPWYRRLGSKGFGIVMHALAGLDDVPDTQCGFKFFRRDVAQQLFGRQLIDGYMYDVEILFMAKQQGYQLKQIGIHWRDDRDSRLDLVRGNFRSAIDLLRLRLFLHKAASKPFDQARKFTAQVEDA